MLHSKNDILRICCISCIVGTYAMVVAKRSLFVIWTGAGKGRAQAKQA